MQTPRPFKTTALLVATMLSPLALPQSSYAQLAAAQQAYHVMVVQVKPDMQTEFRALVTNELNPAFRKGGITERNAWSMDTFGASGEYVFVSPIDSMAFFDNPNWAATLIGDKAATILAKYQKLINSQHSYLLTARPALGFAPPAGYVPTIGVALTVDITPGRVQDYEAYFRTLLPVLRKTNVNGVLARSVGLGGNPNGFVAMVLFDSWKDIGLFRAQFEKAAADAKLAPETAGMVASTEWKTYRFARNLSITPATNGTR